MVLRVRSVDPDRVVRNRLAIGEEVGEDVDLYEVSIRFSRRV